VIEITAIRFEGGRGHEHVVEVMWRSSATAVGRTTAQAIVDWLDAGSENQATVTDGHGRLEVAVARMPGRAPHLRCCADGVWTDDLLWLPTF
jgi:hypothetical protein